MPTTAAATASAQLHLELPTSGAYEPLSLARELILAPSGLDENGVAKVLGTVMGYSVDYADLYFQLSREESWSLEDSIVKDGTHNIEQAFLVPGGVKLLYRRRHWQFPRYDEQIGRARVWALLGAHANLDARKLARA